MKKLNGKTVCIIICVLTTVLGAVGGIFSIVLSDAGPEPAR